jgi:hypothetical protein
MSYMANVSDLKRPSLAALQTVETIQSMKPEWLRLPAATRVSGLSRSHLFRGIASGELRSVEIKRPGAKKGIRLVSFSSLMAYIESFAA